MDEQNNSEGFGEVVERETEESTEETSENVGATGSEEQVEETQEETQETEQSEESGTEEPELTEKGTKLDKNPQSALHQQLANERRAKAEMERVLSDPQLLTRFMKQQYGVEVPVQEAAKEIQKKQYTAEDFKDIEDVASKFNELNEGFEKKAKSYESEIKELRTTVTALADGSRNSQIAATTERDATHLRTLPELNPKSSDFIEGLEAKIVNRYAQMDFDDRTGRFKGQTTLGQVAEDVIDAIRLGRQSGSKRAQTIVKDKSEGRVRSNTSAKEGVDTDKLSPSESIAAGIAKLRF